MEKLVSGMGKIRILDKHPGSATLLNSADTNLIDDKAISGQVVPGDGARVRAQEPDHARFGGAQVSRPRLPAQVQGRHLARHAVQYVQHLPVRTRPALHNTQIHGTVQETGVGDP